MPMLGSAYRIAAFSALLASVLSVQRTAAGTGAIIILSVNPSTKIKISSDLAAVHLNRQAQILATVGTEGVVLNRTVANVLPTPALPGGQTVTGTVVGKLNVRGNSVGAVIGSIPDATGNLPSFPVMWTGVHSVTLLPTVPGQISGRALDISDSGVIVGWVQTDLASPPTIRGRIWRPAEVSAASPGRQTGHDTAPSSAVADTFVQQGMIDLGPAKPEAFSADGTYVVGSSIIDGNTVPAIWDLNGVASNLLIPSGYDQGYAIGRAANGVIAGALRTTVGGAYRPVLWTSPTSEPIVLPFLPLYDSSNVNAISLDGTVIIGQCTNTTGPAAPAAAIAWVYRDGKMRTLAQYAATLGIAVPTGTVFQNAIAVNDRGEILASGLDATGGAASFLMVPPDTRAYLSASADFDGDFKSDLLWYSARARNYTLISDGTATVRYLADKTESADSGAPPGTVVAQGDPTYVPVGLGDFDGDGRADILWYNTETRRVVVWLMNGPRIAQEGVLGVVSDPAWQVAGVGDFDGDGRADILWRHATTGRLYLYFMNGSAVRSAAALGSGIGQAWSLAGIADFDRDGRDDLLWYNTETGDLVIHTIDGTKVRSAVYLGRVADLGWEIAGVGDFDGDGSPDILWHHKSTGEVDLYRMVGTTVAGSARVATVTDKDWQIAGVGDYDGDGRTDILWRHKTNGTVQIFRMNGAKVLFGGTAAVVTDSSWKIVRP